MNNSIDALSRKEMLYEMCLKSLGWYKVSDVGAGMEYKPKSNYKRYEECLEEQIKFLPKQFTYNTADELTTDLEKICQQLTGGLVQNLASYYAYKVIK